ncbi:MAG: NADPH-dependent oxidoreductase [bacterium]
MNDILNFLNSHASVREFTKKEITTDEEKLIVTTAQRSPTSSNLQVYSIIGIRDDTKKTKLSKLCGNQKHVEESALFLVFCADLYRLYKINKSKGYSYNGDYTELFIVATVDAALVAGRALMAAQALGYGGVMVGGIRNKIEEVADLLNLPDLCYPLMGMSLGEPIKPSKIKPRLPMDAIYQREKYDDSHDAELIASYDAVMDKMGYLKNNQIMPERFSDYEGNYSWSEHSARRMANGNPSASRPQILTFLQSRGFLKK